MGKLLSSALGYLAIGAVMMLGMRGIEYLIPTPPTRVLICLSDADGTVGACRTLKQILDSHST